MSRVEFLPDYATEHSLRQAPMHDFLQYHQCMNRSFRKTLRLLIDSDDRIAMRGQTKNLSDAARKIGVSQSALNRWLSGSSSDPEGENLTKLLNWFGVTHPQLMGSKPIPALDGRESPDVDSSIERSIDLIILDIKQQDRLFKTAFSALYWGVRDSIKVMNRPGITGSIKRQAKNPIK